MVFTLVAARGPEISTALSFVIPERSRVICSAPRRHTQLSAVLTQTLTPCVNCSREPPERCGMGAVHPKPWGGRAGACVSKGPTLCLLCQCRARITGRVPVLWTRLRHRVSFRPASFHRSPHRFPPSRNLRRPRRGTHIWSLVRRAARAAQTNWTYQSS